MPSAHRDVGYGDGRAWLGCHLRSVDDRCKSLFVVASENSVEPPMRFARGEEPYRFIRNRSRTSLVALRSDATAEKSEDQLFARFLELFDFRLLQQYLPRTDIGGRGCMRC